MSYIVTNEDLKVILDWQNARSAQYMLDESQENVDVVIPLARSKGSGKISLESLDAAIAISFRSLKYMRGQEHPVIKQELAQKAKDAAEKAQAERDKIELNKKRQRDREVLAGQSPKNVRTEMDRFDKNVQDAQAKKDAGKKAPLTDEELEAKAEVERISSTYTVTRVGRTDHSKSAERREQLRQIIARKRDGSPDYVATLAKANEMLVRFENEDSRRIY
jgi:hypothetical protein